MAYTHLPTDSFLSRLETLLEAAETPQAGLDAALREILAASGASQGLVALILPGESQSRLLSLRGLPEEISQDPALTRGLILTLQGRPPLTMLRRRVMAALPVPSPAGYQGALVLFGRTNVSDPASLYAGTSAIGLWAQRLRRTSVPADVTLLLRSRNTLRALFDNLPLSLYIVDCNYNLAALNKSRAERAHLRPNDAVGMKCFKALYGRASSCPGCRVQESLQGGATTSRTSRLKSRQRVLNEWEISTYAIPDPAGETMQAIVMEIDITEKKRLEAGLVQSEKMAAVGQLAAGVAHEINNPLAIIIANAQLLASDLPKNSALQESLDLIQMASSRANEVVSALLGYSRKEEYSFKPLDVNENIRKSILLVQHEIDKHHAVLKQNLAKRLPRIYASATHLQGVWTNLILNALDAPGKEPLEIVIDTRITPEGIMITVCDNGMGIPEDDRQRIFEPFYTTKGPGIGTGLGLSICQRAVRHHGGTIEVESITGAGSRFIIQLPIKPPEMANNTR